MVAGVCGDGDTGEKIAADVDWLGELLQGRAGSGLQKGGWRWAEVEIMVKIPSIEFWQVSCSLLPSTSITERGPAKGTNFGHRVIIPEMGSEDILSRSGQSNSADI